MKLIATTVIFASIIAAFIIPLYIFVRIKDRKRDKRGSLTVLKYGAAWETPVLTALAFLLYIGIILCGTLCYAYGEGVYGFIFLPIIFTFDFVMCLGAVSNKYAYIVFRDDIMFNASIFLKDTETPYSDLKYYAWSGYRGGQLTLCIVDKYGSGVNFYGIHYRNRSAAATVIDFLESKSIYEVQDNNVVREMQNNKVFKRKYSKGAAVFMLISCAVCVAIALYIMLVSTVTGLWAISYCFFGMGGFLAAIAVYFAIIYAKNKQ